MHKLKVFDNISLKIAGGTIMDKNIMWIAKRLKDVVADMSKLTETEKREVIERLDTISSSATFELYNVLNEYMK